MNWYEFVFSTKKNYRLSRHVVFWFVWAVYFSTSYYHYHQVGLQRIQFEELNTPYFIKSLIQLSIHVTTCYFFIDYLIPDYISKRKISLLTWNIFAIGIVILLLGYYIHKTIFPLINSAFDYHPVIAPQNLWWTSATSFLLSAPKVICIAAAIRLLKRWWLKEHEKEKLVKEKLLADLQLLKGQMHPEFLFSSLDTIIFLLNKKNIPNAAMSLLKLADILSYMLYEGNNKFVRLEQEIKAIKDYLVLVKNKMGNRLEIDIAIKGNIKEYEIVPMILFPFIQNSFSYLIDKNMERSWLNLEFQVENNYLTMKLIHGKTQNLSATDNILEKIMKRLNHYYQGQFEIRSTVEPEIMLTTLKIWLGNPIDEIKFTDTLIKQPVYASL